MFCQDGDLRLRTMTDSAEDYERLVRWHNQPHVREWWDPDDPPMTLEAAMADYGSRLMPDDPERLAFIEVGGEPVGFVQFYPWSAFADELTELGIELPEGAWGLDVFIGEPAWINRGIGSRTVRLLCDHLFATEDATAIAFGVDRQNARAQRAYEKAGMSRTVEFLDSDTRNGQRTTSILLVRRREAGGAASL